MSYRAICILFVMGWLVQPVSAVARTTTVTVDKRGAIRIPVATLRQVGVKPDRTGAVWIRFPLPAAEKRPNRPPGATRDLLPMLPSRILLSVDKGQVVFSRTRVGKKSFMPGAPGTKYLASGSGNELVLRNP